MCDKYKVHISLIVFVLIRDGTRGSNEYHAAPYIILRKASATYEELNFGCHSKWMQLSICKLQGSPRIMYGIVCCQFHSTMPTLLLSTCSYQKIQSSLRDEIKATRGSVKIIVAPEREMSQKGILERLTEGVVIGDGGFVTIMEKRGYAKVGEWLPEATVEHPEAGKIK